LRFALNGVRPGKRTFEDRLVPKKNDKGKVPFPRKDAQAPTSMPDFFMRKYN